MSFTEHVRRDRLWLWGKNRIEHTTAIFRQINMDKPATHHDALEFPDGKIVLLNHLKVGQKATVLQLPVKHGVRVPGPKRRRSSCFLRFGPKKIPRLWSRRLGLIHPSSSLLVPD